MWQERLSALKDTPGISFAVQGDILSVSDESVKLLSVGLPYRYLLLADHDTVLVDAYDFLFVYNVRTMHTHKAIGGQLFFELFQTHQG